MARSSRSLAAEMAQVDENDESDNEAESDFEVPGEEFDSESSSNDGTSVEESGDEFSDDEAWEEAMKKRGQAELAVEPDGGFRVHDAFPELDQQPTGEYYQLINCLSVDCYYFVSASHLSG